jgi:PAS domain S-box-containing protein
MQGMISSKRSKNSGIRFYRLMSLVGIVSSLFFATVFLIVYQSEQELIWDRLIVFVFSSVAYAASFSTKVPRKILYRLATVMFYIFTTQVIVSATLNQFEFIYLVALFLTLQAITISFRDEKQAGHYLAFVVIASTMGLGLCNNLTLSESIFVFSTLLISCLLLLIIVRIKARFQKNILIHEELLVTIVSKTEDAIFLTDFEGDINEANERAEEMFGYSLAELEGINFSVMRAHELTKEDDETGVTQLLENKFWNSEVELKRKDGSEFIGYVSVGWIMKFQNEYLVYRIKDITERKESEKELIRAKERAEDAAKAKSQFLATMSHEIRTPMKGVIGMTSLLSQTALDDDQKSYVDTIQKSGENLVVIINDILDFSKIESGKIELEKLDFNLKDLLLDIIKLLGPIAEQKGLDFRWTMGVDVPEWVNGDPTRLKQVIVNLVNNALKFTHEGSVDMHVTHKATTEHNFSLEFKIIDSGIGVPREKQKLLFESFTQVDSSTTRKFGGTGLGLAICKNLVRLMGGTLSVESAVGVGSVFCFSVIFEESLTTERETLEDNELDNMLASYDLSSLRVLLAEDNLVNQQVAQLILGNIGIFCDVVVNGVEAVEAVRSGNYDVVFMDVQMPEMDGLQASRVIREDEKFDTLCIVALTANAMQEDRVACLDAGMDLFLSKPILISDLKRTLVRILDQGRAVSQGD